jgi:type II secretion system protein C
MWQRLKKVVLDWRQRVPRWTATLLAGLIAGDLAHFAVVLRPTSPVRRPHPPIVSRLPYPGFDVQPVVQAHLFGIKARVADAGAQNAPETQLALALTGIIATKDPNDGYAILGEQGKPTRLYRSGAALASAADGRLYRVFADRVVLVVGGRLETLRLPHAKPPALMQVASAAASTDPSTPAESAQSEQPKPPPTAAETLFGNFDAERNNVDGRLAGMILHPAKRLQRQYGFHDGDTLTAVNGVEITDPDVLAAALRTSAKSLSLTFTRNGEQRTMNLPVNN